MRCSDGPKIRLVLVCNGIDRFKNSELYDRRVACLGEGILLVGDGCVYRNRIPVQNGISSCGCRSNCKTQHQYTKELGNLFHSSCPPSVSFVVPPIDRRERNDCIAPSFSAIAATLSFP